MWFDFLILGLFFSLVLWVIEKKRYKSGIIIIILCLLMATFNFIIKDHIYLSHQNWFNESPWIEIILFSIMILGMASSYITKAIEKRREKIKEEREKNKGVLNKKIKLEFDLWEFSYPMFTSVITYGILLSALEENKLNMANIIISFQTGFFWQTILIKEKEKY